MIPPSPPCSEMRWPGSPPGCRELVYDNYNALVVGFGPSERASEAVLSLAVYPRWVTLFFMRGGALDDPERLLDGSGKQVRSRRLAQAADIDAPGVASLISQAVGHSGAEFGDETRGRLVIRSVSAKQRPRRPGR
jgi:Domain of unknown function (DU1801)